MDTKEALINYCTRLGDNNLILAQRLAEWCSNGPILEEDLAITNVSLDCFGQAEFMFEYAVELEGNTRSADDLAFRRNERQYLNCLLVEQPNGDFAFTMMKLMLYSTFAKHLYETLSSSADEKLAALATRALKEAKYHFRHSSEWLVRLGNGTAESRRRAQQALNELWMFTGNLFAANETDKILAGAGIGANPEEIFPKWHFTVAEVLVMSRLEIPQNVHMVKGGIDGIHTEHLGHLLCEMQYLQRAYPDAKW